MMIKIVIIPLILYQNLIKNEYIGLSHFVAYISDLEKEL
jgi:hypothetical protein